MSSIKKSESDASNLTLNSTKEWPKKEKIKSFKNISDFYRSVPSN